MTIQEAVAIVTKRCKSDRIAFGVDYWVRGMTYSPAAEFRIYDGKTHFYGRTLEEAVKAFLEVYEGETMQAERSEAPEAFDALNEIAHAIPPRNANA